MSQARNLNYISTCILTLYRLSHTLEAVFCINKAFDYSISGVFTCTGYQGVLDATLNYPMYFKLLDAFQRQQTMINIRNGVTQNSVFPDVSILGNFVDNHDNPRFLHNNGDQTLLKNALAYIVFAEVCTATQWQHCYYTMYIMCIRITMMI